MNRWLKLLDALLTDNQSVVVITQIKVTGSAPRETGAKMLVTSDSSYLSIGGGHLEYRAIELARNMLDEQCSQSVQQFSLGAALGQCCGGAVTLLFERFDGPQEWLGKAHDLLSCDQSVILLTRLDSDSPEHVVVSDLDQVPQLSNVVQNHLQQRQDCTLQAIPDKKAAQGRYLCQSLRPLDFNILIFGAGHIGQALVQMMSLQSCQITWVDTRDDPFGGVQADNVISVSTDTPEAEITLAPMNSYYVIMTHDHALDLRLTEAVLKREDFAYLGLVGSRSKRARFEHRLRDKGFSADQLTAISCPIGIAGIDSRQPAAIALSVSAQLMQLEQYRQSNLLPTVNDSDKVFA